MSKREKAFYDALPKGLSHEAKLAWMAHWTSKFMMLPPRTRQRFVKQAYADRDSQFVVRHNGKLVSVPQHSVEKTLKRLGIEIQAECILLA